MRLGVVLGAGGVTGEAFHRGVLTAMADAGLDARRADLIVGTSAGALIAASLRRHAGEVPGAATRREPDRRQPDRPARPPARPAVRPSGRLPGRGRLLDLAREPRRLISGAVLRPGFMAGRHDLAFIHDGLRRVHGVGWPAAPLWIPAVRRRDGRRVVFGRPGGPVADVGAAVAASCAVPGYFRPVDIGGESYVDGGMCSPTNVDLLAGCDLDVLVISSPMSVDLASVPAAVDLPLRLWFNHLLREETWVLHGSGADIVVIEPDRATIQAAGLSMLNGRRLDEVEERAHAHARRRLDAALPRPGRIPAAAT